MNWAVIGTNYITDWFLQSSAYCDDFQLVAVYSRDLARAKEFGEKYGATMFFDDLEKMAKDPAIDAVYIASPTYCHHDHAILMMRGKKHVLCEKPVAANAKELKEMLQTAKENHVVFMEALRTLFMPEFDLIQKNMHKLGTIRRVTISYCQYSGRYDNFRNGIIENAFRPELCNGSLMDIGVYSVNAMVKLFGKPEKVVGMAVKLHNGVDGEGTILAQYPGMLAEIIYSKITWALNETEIMGEDGYMTVNNITHPKKIMIYYNDGRKEPIPFDITPDNQRLLAELRLFQTFVRQGKFPEEENDRFVIAMEIMDQARKDMAIVFPNDQK